MSALDDLPRNLAAIIGKLDEGNEQILQGTDRKGYPYQRTYQERAQR